MWVTLFRSQILTTLSSLISCNPLCRLLCYKLRYAIIVHRTFIHDRSAPHVHVVISHYEQNGHLKTEIIIQSSLVSASKRVQLSLSKYVIFRTVEKCLKNVTKHRSDIRIICRQRVRIRGRATHWWTPRSLERWWVHSLPDRKQNQNRRWLTNPQTGREHCWNMTEMKFYETTAARTLYDVVEVTVVGAVIKQAVPECRHGWSLNSEQIQQVKYIYSILFFFFNSC